MRTPLLHRLAGDDALAARAGAGDDLAFAALVRRVQPRLLAYCTAIMGDAQDADDAVQNTFIKALSGLRRGEAVLAVRPWLYRIAHNEAISLMRRRRPAGELVATVPDHAHGPAETVAVREEVRAVLHAIGELPDRSRDAFLLREVGGMRHAEVAEVLGTSPGNARQAVFEARLALQDDRAGRDASCQAIREEMSARERRRASRAVRGHLRSCTSCRAWSDAQAQRRKALGLAPGMGVAGAGGVWSWLAGFAGGGAAGGAATVKIVASVAAVATVAPVGVGTLERELHRQDRAPRVAQPVTRTATTERPAATAGAAPPPAPAPAVTQAATAPVERLQADAPAQARARTHEKDDVEAEADWGTRSLYSDGAGEDEPAPDAARRLAPAAPKTHKGQEHAVSWQRPPTRRTRTREPAATVPTEEPAPATPQQEEEEPAKTTPDVPPTTSTQPAPEPEATPTVATQPVAPAPPEEEVPAG